MDRRSQLAQNLSTVLARVNELCEKYGRSTEDVSVIVVTKTWPLTDIELLAELGVRDVGENKDQEAKVKVADCQSDLTWHSIGQIQSNKAKSIGEWADVVHGVNRAEIADRLSVVGQTKAAPIKVLIQVNLDEVPLDHRGGVVASEVPALAAHIDGLPGLELVGVMGVAPLGGDADAAFANLKDVANDLQNAYSSATWISAGMSDDMEFAIKNGATHLRIGSAILGYRTYNG